MKKGHRKYQYDDNIFENIDSKEKAYWHGLISADGYVSTKNFSLGLNMSVKDEILGDKFLMFLKAPNSIKKYRIKKPDKYHSKKREYKYFSVVVYSEKLVKDFLKHNGLKCSRKAKRLSLPDFYDEKINLAWILGYYDGDGSEKCPRLSSSSYILLKQIKEKYNIDFDIWTNGNVHVLYCGEHFREMLCRNYEDSLKRKRVEILGRPNRLKNKNLDFITAEILTSLVKTHSLAEIGKMFGVSRVSLFVKAKRENITIPKRKGGRKPKDRRKQILIKESCKYFPCHINMESCEFCYCPLYLYDCNGNFKILDNGRKDCSDCSIPHSKDGYDRIIEFLKKT